MSSYNRYLAVASRAVRRALKEEKAVKADTEIKVAKWAVRNGPLGHALGDTGDTDVAGQNGKQSEPVSLAEASAALRAEAAAQKSS